MSWTGSEILDTGKYFDVKCPLCAYEIEFWKDEPYYNCPDCHNEVRNPRLDTGCANWCKYAEENILN
jgi:hypothetical protein